jgi:hypothetical protein
MPAYIVGRDSYLGGSCCCDDLLDSNTATFFNNLANKLLTMSEKIEAKIKELQNKPCPVQPRGFIFASIETPKMVLGVKYEYVEYIKRYGPPENGKFNEELLEKIRKEFGISSSKI